MNFGSTAFILYFLPIFLIVYGIVPKIAKNAVLVIGSLIFYAYGDWKNLFLLIVSVVVNYGFGRAIDAFAWSKQKKPGFFW